MPTAAARSSSPCGSSDRRSHERHGKLDGKVAIITGAARGQGEAEARLFVAEGAKVVLADVLEEGETVAKGLGDAAVFTNLDVTDEAAWQATIALATDGSVASMCSSTTRAILGFAAIDKMPAEQFRKVLDVNTTGTFLGMKSVVPAMAARGRRRDRQHLVDRGAHGSGVPERVRRLQVGGPRA